jgi:type IV secretory pathway TraG/TraD family ATPase VirD4
MSGGGKSRLTFYIVLFFSFYAIYFGVKKKAAFRCCFIFLLIFSLFMQFIYLFSWRVKKLFFKEEEENNMADDEQEAYRMWRVRKTIFEVFFNI